MGWRLKLVALTLFALTAIVWSTYVLFGWYGPAAVITLLLVDGFEVVPRIRRRIRWWRRTDEEKLRLAWHEAAHALVAHYMPCLERTEEVTTRSTRPGVVGHHRALVSAGALKLPTDVGIAQERLAICAAGAHGERIGGLPPDQKHGSYDDFLSALFWAEVCAGLTPTGTRGEAALRWFDDTERSRRGEPSSPERLRVHAALRDGNLCASLILEAREEKLAELAEALLKRHTLQAADIERILGPRPPHDGVTYGYTVYLPR